MVSLNPTQIQIRIWQIEYAIICNISMGNIEEHDCDKRAE